MGQAAPVGEQGPSGHQRGVVLHSSREVVQGGVGLHPVLNSPSKVVVVVGDTIRGEAADHNLVMYSN